MTNSYGKQIKDLREKLRMSQREFAEKLGTTRHTVGYWENETRKPSDEMARKLLTLASKYDFEHASRV